jgi:glycine/D-amino acid oxidase-like deaminating enzyme
MVLPLSTSGSGLTRRAVLGGVGAMPLAGLAAAGSGAGGAARSASAPHVAVVGAGAFGGWTALWLRRRGARVTLVDPWGPGNSRSSSGGETRVLRAVYGPDRVYSEWAARALVHWRDLERGAGPPLFHALGALWMFAGDDAYARASLPALGELGLPIEELQPAEAARRFPQVDFAGVRSVFLESRAGYVAARRACQVVAQEAARAGVELRSAAARPGRIAAGRMPALALADGSALAADLHVFACGPWLAGLLPEVLGGGLRVTRQEVFFFGPPAGERRYDEESLPAWIDFGERILYGVPGNEHRGFKVADDTRGAEMDPTADERQPSAAGLERARAHLARRFPGLAGAPLLEARVCQYENTPDGHLLAGRHPEAANVWILGGGSGHGFKLAPVVGEEASRWVLGESEPPAHFALGRLSRLQAGPARTQFQSEARG